MSKTRRISDIHAALWINPQRRVRREEYLDFMSFRRNERPLFTELFGPIVGLKEEDTLYLSAGEARMEAQQREVMKRITKLDSYSHKIGYTALALTVILAGMWVFSVARELL